MTLFYRGHCARVTHEVFEVCSPYHRVFAIRELRYVHVVRETIAEAVTGSAPVTVCSTGLAGISVAVTATGWPIFDHPAMSLAGLVVLAASTAVSSASWRVRRRPNALWAIYQGRLVCLFESTDSLAFGQVSRALLRAMEVIDDER